MKKTTIASRGTIHLVSVLMVIATGLVAAFIASASSAHAQANNTSSPAAAGNNTRVIVTLEVKQGKKQEALNGLAILAEIGKKSPGNIPYNIRASSSFIAKLVREGFDLFLLIILLTGLHVVNQKIMDNLCSGNYTLTRIDNRRISNHDPRNIPSCYSGD